MAIIGVMKQENKIAQMAALALEMYPNADILAIKGALRYGAKWAIEKSSYKAWCDVARQPAYIRRDFFNKLLQESRLLLETAVGGENVDRLIEKLKMENEKWTRT